MTKRCNLVNYNHPSNKKAGKVDVRPKLRAKRQAQVLKYRSPKINILHHSNNETASIAVKE